MHPLEGITVIELARVLACPFAGMILAELGATVIKVEEPSAGDETRAFEPRVGTESAYYFACNRSKQSITVNLRSAGGQEIVRRLAAQADVVIENFPVGTLARYGLDYASLRHDRLVYLSCTGFGQTGPYAQRKGYDTIFQAMGGLMSLTGERDGAPVKAGLPMSDLSSALWIAIGVLAALQARSSGSGSCHIDFSMLDGQVSLLTLAAARYFALAEVPARMGTEHPGRVPSASFRCRDDRWLHITASDQHWAPLCAVLDVATWGRRLEFSTNQGRVTHREEIMRVLTERIGQHDRDALCAACEARGVPAGPLNDVAEVIADPHVIARGMIGSFVHPTVGAFRALPLPFRFAGCEPSSLDRPPLLGEHTDAVLGGRLGFSAAEIDALRAEGAI